MASLTLSEIECGKLTRYVTSKSLGRINKLIKASVRYTEATPLTRPPVSMRFYIYLWSRSRDGANVGSVQPPSVSRRRYSVYSPVDRIHCEVVYGRSYTIVTCYPSYTNQCEHDGGNRGLPLERIAAFISANMAKSDTPSASGRNHACWLIRLFVNPRCSMPDIFSRIVITLRLLLGTYYELFGFRLELFCFL